MKQQRVEGIYNAHSSPYLLSKGSVWLKNIEMVKSRQAFVNSLMKAGIQ
jgi:hypothetical protein